MNGQQKMYSLQYLLLNVSYKQFDFRSVKQRSCLENECSSITSCFSVFIVISDFFIKQFNDLFSPLAGEKIEKLPPKEKALIFNSIVRTTRQDQVDLFPVKCTVYFSEKSRLKLTENWAEDFLFCGLFLRSRLKKSGNKAQTLFRESVLRLIQAQ